ncbi:hypothetical protein HZH66_013348 [Vespula vulgaris]|uniref:Receptor ligand binding region domain-containing protein n=1 Tax=Vespula vulgaris TaxID=7454 RepID=A0A834J8D3_VESVU|nr:hypothetical protein HZH66_013348 [Vespula vulgaris]
MEKFRQWGLICAIIAACTCGVRTECESRGHISLLTSIHDDAPCKKISTKGVLLYEAAKLLTEIHNNKSNTMDIEIAVFDTCGSITGALKAAMKALVAADVNCLQAPHYLGIIGPDTTTNAEAVHKVTSILKIPHIVRKASNAPYLHQLVHESDSYLVEGVLKIVQLLKWKSFTLVANVEEELDDDVQNIAKKLTMAAIAKNLCVLVHNDDDDDDNDKDNINDKNEDYTSHVIHIGQPDKGFFNKFVNATVLVVSEGNLDEHLNSVDTSNTILLLEDSREVLPGLERRVDTSKWWSGGDGTDKYDAEALREVRWLEDAIEIYIKAIDMVCKKKKCKNPMNSVDWNNILSNVLISHNIESQDAPQSLDLLIKMKGSKLENLGSVIVKKNSVKIQWEEEDDDDDDNDDDNGKNDDIPDAFEKIVSEEKGTRSGCATKEMKMLYENGHDTTHILVSEMDDSEWWTMVGTVSGVGVAMFVVGILAVYVVYTNIRGPVQKHNKSRIDRDTSLRRVGSDRELPTSARTTRQTRGAQRRDSNRSIRKENKEQ